MAYNSSIAKDKDQLLNDWARKDTEVRCPDMHHEYCNDSNKGRCRKNRVASRQSRSNNKRANINSKHKTDFEYRYGETTMKAESHQIAEYVSKHHKHKSRKNKYAHLVGVKREKTAK